jgi:hypothetical protein
MSLITKLFAAARRQPSMRVLTLVLAGCLAVGVVMAPGDAAAVDTSKALTLISAAAVVIERLLELLWGLLGQSRRFGGWWPLDAVVAAVKRYETETNAAFAEPVGIVAREFEKAVASLGLAEEQVIEAEHRLAAVKAAAHEAGGRFTARLATLDDLAPGSTRLAVVSKAAQKGYRDIETAIDAAFGAQDDIAVRLKSGLATAHDGADAALDVVEAFADNPARKVASLMLGMSAGVVVAAALGLNMVVSVLGSGAPTGLGLLDGRLGVLATGLVIGLGANPTHEAIKALSRLKQRNGWVQAVADLTSPSSSDPDVSAPAPTTRGAAASQPGARYVKATD